jgi:hypothetical protein
MKFPGAMLTVSGANEPAEELLLASITSTGLLPAFPASGCPKPSFVGVLFPSFVSTSVTTVIACAPPDEALTLKEPNSSFGPETRIAEGARVTVSVPDPFEVVLAVYVTV